MHPRTALAAILAIALVSARAAAQMPAVSPQTDPPPGELADPIEALMAPGGQHVAVGRKMLEFWWVKSLPLMPASNAISWGSVEEGTLVGAVKLSSAYPDVRGKTLNPGIYTLRYGLQPQDGNHLGVSPHRDFLLLSPAAADNSTAALGHDAAVGLSRLAIGASHPASWSLDPPMAAGQSVGSTKTNEVGQVAVIFSIAASRDGRDAGALAFGLVLVGTVQP